MDMDDLKAADLPKLARLHSERWAIAEAFLPELTLWTKSQQRHFR